VGLRLHNTLTGRKDEFVPLQPGRVGMYTCGPTVWNYSHVGNFRAYLFYDLLRRHLEVSGLAVTHVMNITDVDDRIVDQATIAGTSIRDYVRHYEEAFFADLATMRARRAEVYPKASEHVRDMVRLIERLLASGHAYATDGDVYYRISSFEPYGRLSRLDRSGLKAGARVSHDRYDKESATDFALWKREQPGDVVAGANWEAPFGRGRPGWHIECSAMSMRYLGETLDIHAGGIDLLFPHHENEIAQSEAATGKLFSRWWLHSEFLSDATGEKMSKSLGNFATLRDLVAAGHDPLALRFFLIANAHYRSRLRLDEAALHAAAEQVRRLREFAARLAGYEVSLDTEWLLQEARDARSHYRAALDDDLNLPQGVGYVFDIVREANAAMDEGRLGADARKELLGLLADADAHLDVLQGGELILDADVEQLISEREAARAARDFSRADAIRQQLRDRGIQLEDTAAGVRWRRANP
jgi:cysteinyl-tRNA synthetase